MRKLRLTSVIALLFAIFLLIGCGKKRVATTPPATAPQPEAVVEPAPAPATEPPAEPIPTETETDRAAFERLVRPVFFDYDKFDIRSDQNSTVAANADFLTGKKHLRVVIEGYADERGSTEYNLALGESRAQTVKQALVREGVNPDHVKVISYGKERQFCNDSNEMCWQQNRRAQLGLSD